jgi:serine/threonine protein kinase
MHLPRSNDTGKSRSEPAPTGPAEEDYTPLPTDGDSEEQSWEQLGSTRVVEGETPANLVRPNDPNDQTEAETSRSAGPRSAGPRSAQPPEDFGDYRLIRRIGEGAMGAVYLARQLSFERYVALKILFQHIAANPKLVQRLYREGLVMGQLDHPHIVQAFGVDEHQGWHYIALEYVDGISLQKWLIKLGRLGLGDALLIAITVAKALEYAHKQGFVHRDIKPDNVLITRAGLIKVADLGMVKIDDEDMALTQTGHAVGTPWYMPLEQARNAKDTDGRSDIYALGCLLYCTLTGNPPFHGKTLLEVIQAKEAGYFPPARQTNADIPERLDLIIAKMTAKRVKDRYQTCAELIKDLESLRLANAKLSFLDGPAKVEPPMSDSGSRPAAPEPMDQSDPNIWYVRIKDPEGRATVHKLPTAQVSKMLEEDKLGPNVKASHHPKEGFRALATYKEFQGVALVKASKAAADQQAVRYRTLYKKIEEKERLRNEEEEERRAPRAPEWVAVWSPLVIKFGGIGLAVLAAILFLWWVVTGLF